MIPQSKRRQWKLRLVGSACVLLSGCNGPGAGDELTTAEVLSTIQAFDEAWRGKDSAAVAAFLADDYSYSSSTGGLLTREWLLEELLGDPEYRLDRSERNELHVVLYGTTAVVSSRWRGVGSYRGEPIRDDQRCSLVMVRDGARVRIVTEHCTQIAQ